MFEIINLFKLLIPEIYMAANFKTLTVIVPASQVNLGG